MSKLTYVLHTDRIRGVAPEHLGPETKTCEECGELFRRDTRCTWAHWGRVRFCSRKCVGKNHARTAPDRRPSISEFFERYVIRNETGCWGWRGHFNKRGGYPIFPYAGKMLYGHRVSMELAGHVIPSGMFVCHHCDNPECTRPDHLYIGTPTQNVADMHARGRYRNGAKAKLTAEHVAAIRVSTQTDTQLAERFNVSRSTISMARARKTWRNVA